jgi:hypothetical protein
MKVQTKNLIKKNHSFARVLRELKKHGVIDRAFSPVDVTFSPDSKESALSYTPHCGGWNGSLGEDETREAAFIVFTDGSVERVAHSFRWGSNYAYTETYEGDGETVAACIKRVGKRAKLIVTAGWWFDDWSGRDRDEGSFFNVVWL